MVRISAALSLAALAAACGSSNSTGSGSNGVQNNATVTLNASGPSPEFVEVLAGGHLTFVNGSGAPRQITSADCADIATGRLSPGADQELELHDGPRSCTYTDALGATWQGHLQILEHPRDGGDGSR